MIEGAVSDVKTLEAELSQNPDSYLFARLSEALLREGLVERALDVARQGVKRHPRHVAGQRAFALAAYARGSEDECREALKAVVDAVPEDAESQKLLARLLVASGRSDEAIHAYRTILQFACDDEILAELKHLESASGMAATVTPDALDAEFDTFEDDFQEDEEIIEDLEILEMDEADVIEELQEEEFEETTLAPPSEYDPLSTATLAELYRQQGFYDKALDVYRNMSLKDRSDEKVKRRIEELEALLGDGRRMVDPVPAGEGAGLMQSSGIPGNAALQVLETWLDNVRRYKACR